MSEQRPRVLVLSPGFPPARGGIERTAGELASGLRGCDLEVVAGAPPPGAGPGITCGPGVRVHWTPNAPRGGRRATAALLRRAIAVGMRFRPDVVIALHIRTMPAARVLGLLIRSRALLVIHAKEVREQPALCRAAVRWADAVVTVSGFARALALECGARPDRLHTIHPGVTIPPASAPPLGERGGPPTVLTVARMDDRHKGHAAALRVLAQLRSRIPGVRWVMVGDGSLRSGLQREAARIGLEDSVLFTGALSDRSLSDWLSSAHAFCMLSQEPGRGAAGEGFGIVLVEAGAHGLPVVAGRVPGVIDAVRDGTTGLLVDPRDDGKAVDALERVLTDSELAARLARAGVDHARELAWPIVAERYRRLLTEIVMAPARGRPSRDPRWFIDLATGPELSG